jgi:hypothetical protein
MKITAFMRKNRMGQTSPNLCNFGTKVLTKTVIVSWGDNSQQTRQAAPPSWRLTLAIKNCTEMTG